MRVLLMGDIHGNIEALDKCLDVCSNEKIDRINVLGDIVGYMANPVECIDAVRNFDCIAGNHDIAVLEDNELEAFNPYARQSILWTRSRIDEEHMNFLKTLLYSKVYLNENYSIAHGSLIDRDMYIMYKHQAAANIKKSSTDLLFTAHTHVPSIWSIFKDDLSDKASEKIGIVHELFEGEIYMDRHMKYIINVGSIGQPRDNNPKGCCVVYDTSFYSIKYIRFDYQMEKTVEKMKLNRLPAYLYTRLYKGY